MLNSHWRVGVMGKNEACCGVMKNGRKNGNLPKICQKCQKTITGGHIARHKRICKGINKIKQQKVYVCNVCKNQKTSVTKQQQLGKNIQQINQILLKDDMAENEIANLNNHQQRYIQEDYCESYTENTEALFQRLRNQSIHYISLQQNFHQIVNENLNYDGQIQNLKDLLSQKVKQNESLKNNIIVQKKQMINYVEQNESLKNHIIVQKQQIIDLKNQLKIMIDFKNQFKLIKNQQMKKIVDYVQQIQKKLNKFNKFMRMQRLREELDKSNNHIRNGTIKYELSNRTGNDKSLKHWIGTIIGPQNTVFNKRTYKLQIKCGQDYPQEPLQIKFTNKINIQSAEKKTGKVINLKELTDWRPQTTIENILVALQNQMNAKKNRIRKPPAKYQE